MHTTTLPDVGITCGHCSTFTTKVKHDTIAQVRLCAHRASTNPVSVRSGSTVTTVVDMSRTERPLLRDQIAADKAARAASTKPASVQPVTAPAPAASTKPEDVPAGRYAVPGGENGALRFYKVDKPTEGRWKGYTFLSVQASDEMHPIRNRAARDTVLRLIALNVKEATRAYGREIGSCGVCGRTLTDEDSRAAGIGPVCASKGF